MARQCCAIDSRDARDVRLAVARAQPRRLVERHPRRHVAERVVRAGLVGDHVHRQAGRRAARAAPPPRWRRRRPTARGPPRGPGRSGAPRRRGRRRPRRGSASPARRRTRCASTSMHSATPSFMVTASGCAPPMPPSPAVTTSRPRRLPPKRCWRDGREGLVRPLEDALGADVDPRPRGHLAVHGEPGRLEVPELLPRRPLRHQQRVGDEHARRHLVGARHPDRLAALHQQGLVVARGRAAWRRWRRSTPSCARRGRCRRTPRGCRGPRRPRGRGCS